MTITITGRINPCGGEGKACVNYEVMIPAVAVHFPDVANCDKYGTINVIELNPPLRKSHADFWTPQTTWAPVIGTEILGKNRPEAFGFIKIKFECPIGGPTYEAWIILPEGHGYSYRDDGVEIIASVWVPGAKRGEFCAIHVDHTLSVERPDWFGRRYGQRYIPAAGS